jgi:uncharacterized membrane protein YozB (DUF420 family)
MTYADLPTVNACLNSASAACLIAGYLCIRRGNQRAHRNFMIAAFSASTLFLLSYLLYHFHAGRTTFQGPPLVRAVYLAILLSHTILAVVMVPMILTTLLHASRGRFEPHRRLARWTWPVWMYVSLTGVVIYLLLYQIYPAR